MAKVNELFNPKTIKRLCSSVKISTAQKKASTEWLKLLESGQLEKEKQNYFKFALIILKDLLGYQIKEEMGYEEGNVEFTFADQKGKKIICFEAKGTKTKDLFAPQFREKKEHSTPIKQTWDYMGTLNLDYGVATNYEQFVLIDKSKGTSKYHTFNFKDVKNNEDKLKEFIAIFSKESIIDKKFVVTLYDQSVIEEKEFTKQFYKLFHETRLMLIKEFQNNAEISREEAIHYAQLFLNRMIFIFFAEDTGKVPQRLIRDQLLKVLDAVPVSEHSRFACDAIYSLFEGLDKGASTPVQIFGFNGGLFQDKIPPRFYVKDLTEPGFFKKEYQNSELKKKVKLDEFAEKIIKKYKNRINPIITNLLYMSSFDFNTELNVNILGHIFEQSLTDLEELQVKDTSKRKKEGIFYTPEYITDYICRDTIISYLSKKNATTSKDLVKEYSNNIEELEEKFKKIKILDPACGSGAFILQAIDILLEIYKEIQTFKEFKGQYSISVKGKKHKQLAEQFTLAKWNEESEARKIIENNIYGVDINEESIEITKLSLFLKIATGNRKLIDLSKNIKVGNSLVDDPKVDERYFDWSKEFSEIIKSGGFDIVIGNPPWVFGGNVGISKEEKKYFKKKYSFATKKLNLFSLFIGKSLDIIKEGGFLGFITPNTLLRVTSYEDIRKLILDKTLIQKIINLQPGVFEGVTASTIMLILQNEKELKKLQKHKIKIFDGVNGNKIEKGQQEFHGGLHIFDLGATGKNYETLEKMKTDSIPLGDISKEMIFGVVITKNKDEVVSDTKKNQKYKPFLEGKDIDKYQINFANKFLLYEKSKLHRSRTPEIFKAEEKLLVQRISGGTKPLKVAYDNQQYYNKESINNIIIGNKKYNPKYILTLLNSNLINWYYSSKFTNASKLTVNVSKAYLSQIPVREISEDEQAEFVKKATRMIELNAEFSDKKQKFVDRVQRNFSIKFEDVDKKEFSEFFTQLKKHNIELSPKDEETEAEYYEKRKIELNEITEKIHEIDGEINDMVYKLYKLTDEEISSIEESLNQ